MKFRNPMLTAVALFMTAGAVACSTDLAGPPALDDAQIDADIAATAGDAVASQVTNFGENVAAAGSFSMVAPSYNLTVGKGTAASANGISPTCSYADGRYSCAATTEQGLSVSRSFAFYNASNQTVQTWDPAVVESVNFQAQVDGNFSRDLVWNAGIHRTADVTVSGLISQQPLRTWNGSGAGNDTISHIGLDGIRTLAGNSTIAVNAVVVPGKDDPNQLPQSGNITVDVQYTAALQAATGAVTKEVTRHVVVTFNGTDTPALQIGSLHCVLHLDTHSVDSCQ
jgi:hypothetical protein